MNDKRPVNLDIGTISFPLPAIASITHRVTGAVLFFGMAVLFWLLADSLSSAEGFARAQACLASFFGRLVVWGVVSALIYHTVAGVRHLIMDAGYGESLEGGTLGAKLVFGISVVLIVIAGLWIW